MKTICIDASRLSNEFCQKLLSKAGEFGEDRRTKRGRRMLIIPKSLFDSAPMRSVGEVDGLFVMKETE